jgi:hypothetical protein
VVELGQRAFARVHRVKEHDVGDDRPDGPAAPGARLREQRFAA